MNKQAELQELKVLLSRWIAEIGLDTELDFFDINKVSEGFVAKLLNSIFDYHLEDLNKIKQNFPTVDLGDIDKKIAVQVTSRTDYNKYKSTLENFVRQDSAGNSLAQIFSNGIIFFKLTNKPIKTGRPELSFIYDKFNKQKHIISYLDLYQIISNLYEVNYEKFKIIKKILNDEFGNKDIDKISKYLDEYERIEILNNVWRYLLDIKDFIHNEFIEILGKGSTNFDEPGWNRIREPWMYAEKHQMAIPDDIFMGIKSLFESLMEFFNVRFKETVNNLSRQLNSTNLTDSQKRQKRQEVFEDLIKNELWHPSNKNIEKIGKLIKVYINDKGY